jgi:hypothetical protein
MKTYDDLPNCSHPGCETIAKTAGLCNTHYMARWRAQQRILEDEVATTIAEHGSPEEFYCDGFRSSQCDKPSVRWWVRESEIRSLCASCTTKYVEYYRMQIRRLELK